MKIASVTNCKLTAVILVFAAWDEVVESTEDRGVASFISDNVLEESEVDDISHSLHASHKHTSGQDDGDFVHEKAHSNAEDIAENRQPKTIVIGVRGFRWDHAEKIKTLLNNKNQHSQIQNLIEHGVYAAAGITPVFPTTPVPNLYSMVTGLFPAEHGIVADQFYDPRDKKTFGVDPYTYIDENKSSEEKQQISIDLGKKIFGGKPIWETMRKGTVACMFWPGCEFGDFEKGHFVKMDEEILLSWDKRVKQVKTWLEEDSIKLVLMDYRDLTEVAGEFGPESKDMEEQLRTFDRQIEKLARVLGSHLVDEEQQESVSQLFEKLNLNVILVGSSGIREIISEEPQLNTEITGKHEDILDVWSMQPSMWLVQPKKDEAFNTYTYFSLYKISRQVEVYEKDYHPMEGPYTGNERIAGVIVTAKSGYKLSDRRGRGHDGKYGDGYTIDDVYMRPAFIAYGSAFKKGLTIEEEKMGTVNMHLLLCMLTSTRPPAEAKSVLSGNPAKENKIRRDKEIREFLSDEVLKIID